MRIVTVAPRLAKLSITVLNPEFTPLALRDRASKLDCFTLRAKTFGQPAIPLSSDTPAIPIPHDVLVFAH
jgi:hypothetical protein